MTASGMRLGQVDTELPAAAALADGAANPTAPMVGAGGMVWNGTTWDRAKSAGAVGDGAAGAALQTVSQLVYNGATWDRLRTPTVWAFAQLTAAGSTAIYTPPGGKKFRLLRFMFFVTGTAALAAAGLTTLSLLDGGGGVFGPYPIFLPAASANVNGWISATPWIDLGNGYLSSTANNVLNGSLSVATTTGYVLACLALTAE